MKVKKAILLPILLFTISISGCDSPNIDPSQGIWEATDITLPNFGVHIDSLKIVVTAKLGLPYGVSVSSHSTIYNYSIWWNDIPLYTSEDDGLIFGVTFDYMCMFYFESDDYSGQIQGHFKSEGDSIYYEGNFQLYDRNSYVSQENAFGYYALRDDIDNLVFTQIAWEK